MAVAVSVAGRVRELREMAVTVALALAVDVAAAGLDWDGLDCTDCCGHRGMEWTGLAPGEDRNGLGWDGCSWVLEVDEAAAAGGAAGWPSCS